MSNWQGFRREFRDGGWRSLLCGAIGYGLGISVLPYFSLGAFVRPLEQTFGWSRGEIQACTLSIVVATLLTASSWGWLTDRYGVRRIGIMSQIGLTLSLLMLAASHGQLWYWYGVWFLMTVVGLGTSPITWTREVVTRFSEGRGFALALALCGSGISSLIMPTTAAFVIEHVGWRYGFVALAASVLFIALPVTIWILPSDAPQPTRGAAPSAGQGLGIRGAMKQTRFWLLTASLMMVGFGLSGLVPNLVPMMIGRGVDATTAASFMGVFGVTVIVGRLASGVALDLVWAPIVALVLLPLPALACIILETGIRDYFAVAGCIALIGLAMGAEFDLAPYLVTRYFGMKSYSQIYAFQWTGFTIASGVAPLVYGHLYDVTGNYSIALYTSAILFVTSPFLLVALGRYPDVSEADNDGSFAASATGARVLEKA